MLDLVLRSRKVSGAPVQLSQKCHGPDIMRLVRFGVYEHTAGAINGVCDTIVFPYLPHRQRETGLDFSLVPRLLVGLFCSSGADKGTKLRKLVTSCALDHQDI